MVFLPHKIVGEYKNVIGLENLNALLTEWLARSQKKSLSCNFPLVGISYSTINRKPQTVWQTRMIALKRKLPAINLLELERSVTQRKQNLKERSVARASSAIFSKRNK